MRFKFYLVLAGMLLGFMPCARAADSLIVGFNKSYYLPGDTISFDAYVPNWVGKRKAGTLNVLIEDVHHIGLWKLRYPVLNGLTSADIVLPDSIRKDAYAFTFRLQNAFFQMHGKVKSRYKDSTIRNVVLLDNKELVAQDLHLDDEKEFEMGKLLFAKQAVVFFSPVPAKKRNDLDIEVVTTLDSAYENLTDTSFILPVGVDTSEVALTKYREEIGLVSGDTSGTLNNVVVTAKRKTLADKYEEEYVNNFFRSDDGFVFSGLDDDQLASAVNILQWLAGRVPGLVVNPDSDGGYSIKWRGSSTALFLDELPADDEMIQSISPADVALIKVFRPPFFGSFGGGAGGAIAVYTKRGIYGESTSGPKHRFLVNGYTPTIYDLPVLSAAGQ